MKDLNFELNDKMNSYFIRSFIPYESVVFTKNFGFDNWARMYVLACVHLEVFILQKLDCKIVILKIG